VRRLRSVSVALVLGVTMMLSGCGLMADGAFDLPLPGGPDLGDDPYTVKVEFRNVQQLVPKSLVKVNNVPVGIVEDIEADSRNWTATVICTVRRGVVLPDNARAAVRQTSLLGEAYVELAPPAGQPPRGRLADGDTVPLPSSGTSAPVEQVLGALSMLLNGGSLPQLQTITSEINKALSGNETDIRSLLHELNSLVGRLDASRNDITRALDGMAHLSQRLADRRGQLATALDQLPQGVRVLAQQRDDLVKMLTGLDRLSAVAVRVVNQSKANTVADLRALRPTLAKLEQAGSNLTGALPILGTFPFTPAAQEGIKGDYLNLHQSLDLNLTHAIGNLSRSNQPLNIGGTLVPNPFAILEGGGTSVTQDVPLLGQSGGGDLPLPPTTSPEPSTPDGSQDGGSGGDSDLLGPLLGGSS